MSRGTRHSSIFAASLMSVALGAPEVTEVNTTHYKFSVASPDGWHHDPAGPAQGLIVSYSSPGGGTSNPANLNVVVRALVRGDTLTTVLQRTDAQLLKEVPGLRKVNSYPSTLGGQPATISTYAIPKQGSTLQSLQTLSVIGTTIYALTGTTDQVNAKTFRPVYEAFVKSFRLKK